MSFLRQRPVLLRFLRWYFKFLDTRTFRKFFECYRIIFITAAIRLLIDNKFAYSLFKFVIADLSLPGLGKCIQKPDPLNY